MIHMKDTDATVIVAKQLISEQKFGEAINCLQNVVNLDNKNQEAIALLEQIQKIVEYQNRDLFGSTNLDMDPWFE
ncbi:MAG: hypothetical protein JXQ80_02890 [Bacteroidales bacterium]|nr:hypothetical protein [Bacteroidales bacterium]